MQRRQFVSALASGVTVGVAGCASGGPDKTVEIVESHIERKDEGTMSETVYVVGSLENVTEDPADVVIEVTFYKSGAFTNTVEKTLTGVKPGTETDFSVEAPSIGRTARNIDGYELILESGGYTTKTETNTGSS